MNGHANVMGLDCKQTQQRGPGFSIDELVNVRNVNQGALNELMLQTTFSLLHLSMSESEDD